MEQEDEAYGLNHNAFLACRGLRDAPLDDLAKLLRSGVPIHREIRDAMADLLEGKLQPRITMSGYRESRDLINAFKKRDQWLEIGRWVAEQIQNGSGRNEALEAAANSGAGVAVSRSYADQALIYAEGLDAWLSRKMEGSIARLPDTDEGRRQAQWFYEQRYHYADFLGISPDIEQTEPR